jgi:hypothetical protein
MKKEGLSPSLQKNTIDNELLEKLGFQAELLWLHTYKQEFTRAYPMSTLLNV